MLVHLDDAGQAAREKATKKRDSSSNDEMKTAEKETCRKTLHEYNEYNGSGKMLYFPNTHFRNVLQNIIN